jgi:hypothetical protein
MKKQIDAIRHVLHQRRSKYVFTLEDRLVSPQFRVVAGCVYPELAHLVHELYGTRIISRRGNFVEVPAPLPFAARLPNLFDDRLPNLHGACYCAAHYYTKGYVLAVFTQWNGVIQARLVRGKWDRRKRERTKGNTS